MGDADVKTQFVPQFHLLCLIKSSRQAGAFAKQISVIQWKCAGLKDKH